MPVTAGDGLTRGEGGLRVVCPPPPPQSPSRAPGAGWARSFPGHRLDGPGAGTRVAPVTNGATSVPLS